MKMKLSALSMAIAAAGLAATVAQAADVALFPYVVKSPTVTTLVSVVDLGDNNTVRYDSGGNPSATGNRLHWRLHYKAGANATNNTAVCQTDGGPYLPTSPNDIQTVDLGGVFGNNTKGVLFNDDSTNNNWNVATVDFRLGHAVGEQVLRGVLFVHNADDVTSSKQTLYGEAMIIDFSTGAAWGYQALLNDNAGSSTGNGFNNADNFNFAPQATNAPNTAPNIVTFMPLSGTTTRIFVTPVNTVGGSMLGANGANISGWNNLNAQVRLQTPNGNHVAFDRDENPVPGVNAQQVVCVGAVDVTQLMSLGAVPALANGGWGELKIDNGSTSGATPTDRAVAIKLEFNNTGMLNGKPIPGTFNNGFIMR